MTHGYNRLSYWWHEAGLEAALEQTPELPDTCDIAIVGAGFTGLWTAYYLAVEDPSLNIVVLEAETPGYGASGRNGGWCLGEVAGIEKQLMNPAHRPGALRLLRAIQQTVDEVGRVCDTENIDCHFQKGGSLTVATTAFQAERCQHHLQEQHRLGLDEDDIRWLDPQESRSRIDTTTNHGALFMPHCAALHPLRLVHGLVRCLRDRGVRIVECTPATAIEPGLVTTVRGELKCAITLRATEAYTDSIRGQRRKLIPVYSLMVATEPLDLKTWENLGLHNRETVAGAQRTVTYGQRTQDDRFAFGARGGYLYGSGVKRTFDAGDPGLLEVARIMHDLFPLLRDKAIDFAWGGMLGVQRNWQPSVTYDPETRIGSAGGYVGEGVAASNLAGRTLTDLVLKKNTAVSELPWIGASPRRWEPEPLRWLGYRVAEVAERQMAKSEMKHGRPSRMAGRVVDWFSG